MYINVTKNKHVLAQCPANENIVSVLLVDVVHKQRLQIERFDSLSHWWLYAVKPNKNELECGIFTHKNNRDFTSHKNERRTSAAAK